MSHEIEQWKIRYTLLLDSATELREAMKDIYNTSFFLTDISPEGMLKAFPSVVRDIAQKALVESASIVPIQHAADLEAVNRKREGATHAN